jgi:hypothetical protein
MDGEEEDQEIDPEQDQKEDGAVTAGPQMTTIREETYVQNEMQTFEPLETEGMYGHY